MWSQVEPSAAILGACIVTYRPLFRNMHIPSIFTKGKDSTESNDVSRRWPTCAESNHGSDDGLVKEQERLNIGKISNVKSTSQIADAQPSFTRNCCTNGIGRGITDIAQRVVGRMMKSPKPRVFPTFATRRPSWLTLGVSIASLRKDIKPLYTTSAVRSASLIKSPAFLHSQNIVVALARDARQKS